MTEISQAIKKAQQGEDDSWLDDEVNDEHEPPAKRPYLETTVSQLISSTATSEAPSTSVASGTCTTVDNDHTITSSILDKHCIVASNGGTLCSTNTRSTRDNRQ